MTKEELEKSKAKILKPWLDKKYSLEVLLELIDFMSMPQDQKEHLKEFTTETFNYQINKNKEAMISKADATQAIEEGITSGYRLHIQDVKNDWDTESLHDAFVALLDKLKKEYKL